jgi:hypothetical protein
LAAAEPRENAEYDVDYNSDRHGHYVMISVSTSRAGRSSRRWWIKSP